MEKHAAKMEGFNAESQTKVAFVCFLGEDYEDASSGIIHHHTHSK